MFGPISESSAGGIHTEISIVWIIAPYILRERGSLVHKHYAIRCISLGQIVKY
jgi:hypothetical protein